MHLCHHFRGMKAEGRIAREPARLGPCTDHPVERHVRVGVLQERGVGAERNEQHLRRNASPLRDKNARAQGLGRDGDRLAHRGRV
jgi:hypothetical protein